MQPLLRTIFFAFGLATTSSAIASATYNFSYWFMGGTHVFGTFTGDASGNLVTNLTDIHVFYGSSAKDLAGADGGPIYSGSFGSVGSGWCASGAIASFDGTANNFRFSTVPQTTQPEAPDTCGWYNYDQNTYFYLVPSHLGGATDTAEFRINSSLVIVDTLNALYYPERWSLAEAQSNVPEPPLLALLGFGLAGLAILRRRKQ